MSDEQDKQQPTPEDEAPQTEEDHSFKESARETVAKAFGVAVELGSILGGEGGDIVPAQRKVAEADAEDLIDKIDGED